MNANRRCQTIATRVDPPKPRHGRSIVSSCTLLSLLLMAWFWSVTSPIRTRGAEKSEGQSAHAVAANSEGFSSLFDGRSLDGWQGGAEGWIAEDGKLVYTAPRKGKDSAGREALKLTSVQEYSDFVLRFEFKLQDGANNGVAVRAPLEGDPAFVGMEIQVIDTDGWPGRLKPFQVHGSIYGVVPAKTGHLKPVGQWNAQEIVCDGRRVKVTLNGVVIVDANLDEVQPIDGDDHPGLKRAQGHIGFLGHTKGVEYRNIQIKELP